MSEKSKLDRLSEALAEAGIEHRMTDGGDILLVPPGEHEMRLIAMEAGWTVSHNGMGLAPFVGPIVSALVVASEVFSE